MINEEKTFLPEETQVVFLHGLESNEKSDKAAWLKKNFNTWAPRINYKNPHEFQDIYNQIMERRPRLIVGSSMGGWFAYALSTLTGIRTLLLNPAVQGRSMEPSGVRLGKTPSNHVVVLGKSDEVIDPIKSVDWFKKNGVGNVEFYHENIGHRTPTNIMTKYVDRAINESLDERKLPDFKYPWTIITNNDGNSRVQFTGSGDDYIVKFNSLNPKSTLCFFESDKLKSAKNGNSSISEVSKVLSTVLFIIEEYLQTNPERVVYFVGAASIGENPEEGELTKRGRVYLDLIKDNIKPGFHWKIANDRVGILIALDETPLVESVNEGWSTESPGNFASPVVFELIATNLKQNFLASRPYPGNLTVEDLDRVKKETITRNEDDVKRILSVLESPVDEFYTWFTIRGYKVNYKELRTIWENPVLIKMTDDLKNHYKRPRPYWLDSSIIPVDGTETSSWSYPSGHSMGAYLIAFEMSKKYPHIADSIMDVAERIAITRAKTGVHFHSDLEAGKEIAKMISEKI
jgi:hypothetical protein